MSIASLLAAGRRKAEQLMTDEWTVVRVTRGALNESTGQYVDTETTIYTGPGKLQSFEAYEQSPEGVAMTATVMRPALHLPVVGDSANVREGDIATCTASATDAALVGTEVRIAGLLTKTNTTARRFPVEQDVT